MYVIAIKGGVNGQPFEAQVMGLCLSEGPLALANFRTINADGSGSTQCTIVGRQGLLWRVQGRALPWDPLQSGTSTIYTKGSYPVMVIS